MPAEIYKICQAAVHTHGSLFFCGDVEVFVGVEGRPCFDEGSGKKEILRRKTGSSG
jgi:hypothetical protein